MLDNFRKNIFNSLHGSSDEANENDLLDAQIAQAESDVHGDPLDINSHWSSTIADTMQVPGCNCIWCRRDNDLDEEVGQRSQPSHPRIRPSRTHRSLMATTRGVMDVLYPPSYLNTPPALHEVSPPTYEPRPVVPPSTPQVQSHLTSSREGSELESFDLATRPPCLIPEGVVTTSPEPVPSYEQSDADVPAPNVTISSARSPPPQLSPSPARLLSRRPITGLGLEPSGDELPAYSRFDSSRPRFPVASDILGPYPHISLLSPDLG